MSTLQVEIKALTAEELKLLAPVLANPLYVRWIAGSEQDIHNDILNSKPSLSQYSAETIHYSNGVAAGKLALMHTLITAIKLAQQEVTTNE